MTSKPIRTASGRSLEEINMEAVRAGELSAEDFRISAETLRRQADVAAAAGYHHFARNLRRAAELACISNEQVFEIYELLRPRRATYAQLTDLASRLEEDLEAPLNAALVREAAEVYLERGVVKGDS